MCTKARKLIVYILLLLPVTSVGEWGHDISRICVPIFKSSYTNLKRQLITDEPRGPKMPYEVFILKVAAGFKGQINVPILECNLPSPHVPPTLPFCAGIYTK